MNDEERGELSHGDAGDDEFGDYCRHVEAYLCRKNDGHLIRIAGPSFSRVTGWGRQGIPLNVVYRGIDRYFERYYSRGQRRRPVHIDFCEDDVLGVFDQWRRAVGFAGKEDATEGIETSPDEDAAANPNQAFRRKPANAVSGATGGRPAPAHMPDPSLRRARDPRAVSLPAHVERVIVRLTTLRAGGRLSPAADATIDAAIRELDAARGDAAHLAGDARVALEDRLRDLDARVVAAVAAGMPERERQEIGREARGELAAFSVGMTAEAYDRAVAANLTRLVRQRTGLPVIAYED